MRASWGRTRISTASCSGPKGAYINTCPPAVIVGDLRRYFLHNQDFELKAVSMAYLHGSVWFTKDEVRKEFYEALVKLLIEPDLKHEGKLLNFIPRFPFSSMRKALESEMNNLDHGPTIRARLKKAYERVLPEKENR